MVPIFIDPSANTLLQNAEINDTPEVVDPRKPVQCFARGKLSTESPVSVERFVPVASSPGIVNFTPEMGFLGLT